MSQYSETYGINQEVNFFARLIEYATKLLLVQRKIRLEHPPRLKSYVVHQPELKKYHSFYNQQHYLHNKISPILLIQ